MGYSIDPISDNCYPGTSVLINKFNIRDEAKLNEVESVLVSARNAEWLSEPEVSTFDFFHYKAIHHFLFSDLYDWAGQVRMVNISKKGTRFTLAESIERQAELIFERLKDCNYFKGLQHDEFIDEIVDFYCVTNELHPFREGNGRTLAVQLLHRFYTKVNREKAKTGSRCSATTSGFLAIFQNSSQTVVKTMQTLQSVV